jgi:Zn finger protein HypA/HybF involved in hydrogenase expression
MRNGLHDRTKRPQTTARSVRSQFNNTPASANLKVKHVKVKCIGCEKKFEVTPENFSNYEIVFCPVCGLDHQVVKAESSVTVKSLQYA